MVAVCWLCRMHSGQNNELNWNIKFLWEHNTNMIFSSTVYHLSSYMTYSAAVLTCGHLQSWSFFNCNYMGIKSLLSVFLLQYSCPTILFAIMHCMCYSYSGIPGKNCGTIILTAEELGNCRVSQQFYFILHRIVLLWIIVFSTAFLFEIYVTLEQWKP